MNLAIRFQCIFQMSALAIFSALDTIVSSQSWSPISLFFPVIHKNYNI